jgi:hypothetical protein
LAKKEILSIMEWNRSNVLGLAKASCFACQGLGIRFVRKDKEVPCNCVFRAVFRACYNRFRQCALSADHIGSVALEYCKGAEGHRNYGRKREEFAADFCLVSRRHLGPSEYQLFRYHFLLGADWKLCCRRLKLERGVFFHSVYRIEHRLGRVFATLQPYPLYPVNEYFGGVIARNRLVTRLEEEDEEYFDEPIAA